MTRLAWNNVGERFYEAGVDRGVLFVDGKPGIPWNGLVSVTEQTSGGEAKPYYLDGIKYLNRSSPEEFSATIEAYTYPDEFSACDGSVDVNNGLYLSQQPRKSFGLCYRSMIGNDAYGVDYAYKIHIIYDALAAPSSKTSTTLGESIEPFNFSWTLSTKPTAVLRRRHTSHFVIDSRKTPAELLRKIEAVLYGDETNDPRLPSVDELVVTFETFGNVFDARLVGQPYYTTFDGGQPPTEAQTETVNGGVP